ncbi:uncharacterized protein LOC128673600 [Plodia interpunctella]|uniref:uncharacterized protein LOC128673600 n=1 Tax=Plodia interpunctella TaxID=58824 RepID=UPI0031018C2B
MRFNDLNISVNTDLILSYAIEDGYKMYEIYNYGKIQGGELIINDLGILNYSKGFNEELNEYKYYKRWNFKQLALRMIVVMSIPTKVFDPVWWEDRRPTPGLATVQKTAGIIFNQIAEIHNLKYAYTIVDRWIGSFNYNDSRKVVATSMYYKFQDISPILRFNTELVSKIEIVHPPLTSIETRYYYRIPTYGPGKFENQFLRPLSPGAWLSVVFISTLCGCLLLLAAKLEHRPASGQYAFFSILASICQQFFEDDFVEMGRSSSARKLTILVTGLACVLIYNYYTSSVVSWLLNGPPPSINSLQELYDSPLQLIYEDIGYSRSWLKSPDYYFNKKNMKIENLMRQKNVLNRKTSDVLTSLDRGIAMVKAGGYAFHTEVESANRYISQTFTQDELCELGSVQSMEKTVLFPIVQKNSPYIEFLNWSLKRFMERGIVSLTGHRTRSTQVTCEGSSPRALALGGAAPAFILLAIGYIVATVIMLIER